MPQEHCEVRKETKAKKKRRVYTREEIATIKAMADNGLGYRGIYDACVKKRRNGKMPWSIGGVKKVVARLQKGQVGRKPGQGTNSLSQEHYSACSISILP